MADGTYSWASRSWTARRRIGIATLHDRAAEGPRRSRGAAREPTRHARPRRCAPKSCSRSIACATSTADGSSCARSIPSATSPPPKRSPPRSRPARIRSPAAPAISSATTCSTRRTRSSRTASTCRRPTPARSAFPLIIALHGLGGTEDSFFDNYEKRLPPLAEQHGYIVAAPLGYRVDGSYGWGLGTPPADPNARRTQDFSEQDVMQVLAARAAAIQDRRQPDLSDGALDGRASARGRSRRSIRTSGRRSRRSPAAGAPATLETHPQRAGDHRARRRRSDGQRRGLARRWWRS